MKTQIKITNESSVCTIDIEGTIGLPESEQFANSVHSIATYERFRQEIENIKSIDSDEIIVNIRSTGGDVNDAMLIYEALVALDTKITTRCYGYTASAATIIAQAASKGCREIASSALYLIHQSSSTIEGNAADLVERIELLQKTDDRISSLYALRSGREKESFDTLMAQNGGRGRWLSPEEVVEAALADEIINDGATKSREGHSIFAAVADKWTKVIAKLGVAPSEKTPQMPADRNILHFESTTTVQDLKPSPSVILFQEGQMRTAPTQIRSKEDPSISGDVYRSPNDCAYAADVRSMSRF